MHKLEISMKTRLFSIFWGTNIFSVITVSRKLIASMTLVTGFENKRFTTEGENLARLTITIGL